MSAEPTPAAPQAELPIVYSVQEAFIAELKSKYLGLRVANVNDTASYELCKKSRTEVRGYRTSVEAERKAQKEGALRFGEKVDAIAKRLMAPLLEIEAHLKEQEAVIDNEKKRLEEEALRKFTERRNARVQALQAVKAGFNYDEVADMTDEAFDLLIAEATESFETSERMRKAEQEKLAKLEAEQADLKAKAKAQQDEIDRLNAEKAEKERADLEESNRKLKAEKLLAEEAERKAREESEAREREIAEAKAAEDARLAAAVEKKRQDEAAAAKQIADRKLFEKIKDEFPTLELAWVEIARLRKAAAGQKKG